MMERNEDLSLSLRSSGDDQQYRQIQLDVMPAPTQSSEIKMMERNENLGFSLSLGSSSTPYMHRQWQLNLVPHQWTELLASSSVPNGAPEMAARLMLRDIDVIRETVAEMESQEAGSSPNSTLSSVCRTRDHKTMIDGGGGGKISKEDGEGCRKKLRLSKDQSVVLEESFKEHNTLTPKEKEALAKQLNLQPRQVEVWVQNRRARTKLKQTEVDCALLKWCCENLTDENQQLRKEVAKLRELKLSPQSYMNMTLPATPTMCPSCECVAPSNNGAATRPANVDHPCL